MMMIPKLKFIGYVVFILWTLTNSCTLAEKAPWKNRLINFRSTGTGWRRSPPGKLSERLVISDDDVEEKALTRRQKAYGQLVQWGIIKPRKRFNSTELVTNTASTIADHFSHFAREFKGYAITDLERHCMKSTRPDDFPPKPKHVWSLISSISRFPEISSKGFDPYSVLLCRLWMIMLEKDWRTSLKAIYVLHKLWRHVSVQENQALRSRMAKLSKQYSAVSRSPMFYASAIEPNAPVMLQFIHAYAVFVFTRALEFSGPFEELKTPIHSNANTRSNNNNNNNAVALRNLQLKRVRKTLSRAVSVRLTSSTANAITATCMDEVLADVEQLVLWLSTYLQEMLARRKEVARNDQRMVPEGSTPKEVQVVVDTCQFYVEFMPQLEKWGQELAKLCENSRHKQTMKRLMRDTVSTQEIDKYLDLFKLPAQRNKQII